MTAVAHAFKSAAEESPIVKKYNEILNSKGWTHARKYAKEAQQDAAKLWLKGDRKPWTEGHIAGLW